MGQAQRAVTNIEGSTPCTTTEGEWHPTVSTRGGALNPVPPVSPRAMKTNPLDRLAHCADELSGARNGLLECVERLADSRLSEHANQLSVLADELGDVVRELLDRPPAQAREVRQGQPEESFQLPHPTPCVPVRLGLEHFVFAEKHVSEAIVLSPAQAREEISFACGAPLIRVENSLLPLIYLSDVLGAKRTEDDSVLTILPVHVRDQTYGLVVDEVSEPIEISCLPPPRVLKGVKTYAGACQLKSGALALVLDPEGVAVAGGMAVGPNAPSQLPPPMQVHAE